MRTRGIVVLATLAILAVPRPASAAISGLQRVASDLSAPIFVTHAPGDRDRLFIVERGSPADSTTASAAIRILDLNTGTVNSTPFLTITGVDNRGEGGLLGFAFHPDYQTNGKFYVYVTAGDSIGGTFFSSYIRQYTVSANPNVANTTSTPILTWGQPQSNHNSGWIGFSPNDGYLYISSGDGGGGFDGGDGSSGHTAGTGNAQDITSNLLGKMLRIDVNGDDFPDAARNYAIPDSNPFADTVDEMGMPVVVTGDDEIWAYGLRNPFRDSFDRDTGDLWIGDVGQNQREEIDFQPASSPGGENYGWRYREGTVQTQNVGQPWIPAYTQPVYDYNRDNDQFGGTVVTGGYVYRGPDPSLQGKYFFLDSRNSFGTTDDNYWMFDPANPYGTVANIDSLLTKDVGLGQFPVSFGEDEVGNLYIAYIFSGEVYRINTNQLLAGDFDADGDVDEMDYNRWKETFGTVGRDMFPPADGNRNGTVDAADYVVWRKNLGASVHDGAGSGGAAVPEPTIAVYLAPLAVLCLMAFRCRTPR